MLSEEFQRALVFHEDLEKTARRLTEEANAKRNEQCRQIQQHLELAKLIQNALLEPRGSGAFQIAKAYLKMYQRKHNPHGDVLVHMLLKEAECSDTNDRREMKSNEPGKGSTAKSGNQYDGVIRGGESGAETVHSSISEGTPREGESME